MAYTTGAPSIYYSHASLGSVLGFANDMAALDAKKEALRLQSVGAFEKALPLMLTSVKLREHSHTLCLSLSELADLYLDMCDFEKADETTCRMLEEAWRYDTQEQTRIANEIVQDSAKGKRVGLMHGAAVKICCPALPHLKDEVGILRGKVRGKSEYYVDVGSVRHVMSQAALTLV